MSFVRIVPKERGDSAAERVLAELEKTGWLAFLENFRAGRLRAKREGPRFAAFRKLAKNTFKHFFDCFGVCRFPRSRVEIVPCARILWNAALKFGILFVKELKLFWFPEDNYNYGKAGRTVSAIVHAAFIVMIFSAGLATREIVKPKKPELGRAVDVSAYLPTGNKSGKSGGGGGGGDRDKLQASQGRLPKQSMQQFTPPMVVVRNENPKLPMDPTIVIPPQVHLTQPNMPNLGDPLSHIPGPPSNGTGSGSGIGSGSGGGVGVGIGPGFGEGRGGGVGGGVFRVGGGVSAPKAIYSPDPEYSEEARKAKYQGTCVLWLVVDQNGRPRDIRVAQTLGLGLDEKAIEAVKTWRFEPAKKDDKPVAVQINIEIEFRLY